MSADQTVVHGTCVALGPKAALLRGAPGAGKSDLALRFLETYRNDSAALISDDQTRLAVRGRELVASAPAPIRGQLEVRGIGIVEVESRAQAVLVVLVDLAGVDEIERLPPDPAPHETILGLTVPVLKLAPFEASAPAKLKLALDRAA